LLLVSPTQRTPSGRISIPTGPLRVIALGRLFWLGKFWVKPAWPSTRVAASPFLIFGLNLSTRWLDMSATHNRSLLSNPIPVGLLRELAPKPPSLAAAEVNAVAAGWPSSTLAFMFFLGDLNSRIRL